MHWEEVSVKEGMGERVEVVDTVRDRERVLDTVEVGDVE